MAESIAGEDKEQEICNKYLLVLQLMLPSYSQYLTGIASLTACLEKNDEERSVAYSFHIFFSLFEQLSKKLNLVPLDYSFIHDDPSNRSLEVLEALFSQKEKSEIRLSNIEFDFSKFSDESLKNELTTILRMIKFKYESREWTAADVENIIISLPFARAISKHFNQLELFYSYLSMVIERLNTSFRNQLARDFAEEILI